MTGSPLGRFAAPAAAAAALFVIVAAVLAHLIRPETRDSFLDALAFAAFGVLIGAPIGQAQGRLEGRAEGETAAVSKINGALAQGAAANTRLDAIGAPSAQHAAVLVSATPATVNLESAPLSATQTAPAVPPPPVDDRLRL